MRSIDTGAVFIARRIDGRKAGRTTLYSCFYGRNPVRRMACCVRLSESVRRLAASVRRTGGRGRSGTAAAAAPGGTDKVRRRQANGASWQLPFEILPSPSLRLSQPQDENMKRVMFWLIWPLQSPSHHRSITFLSVSAAAAVLIPRHEHEACLNSSQTDMHMTATLSACLSVC